VIEPAAFFDTLRAQGVRFFAGVPDSLLKSFCAHVSKTTSPGEHVIASNEGAAVALAVGHYLATGQPALVYMQNSGQGNALNPLVSLAAPDIFGIPMLLMIGWRGEPGVSDEPQHVRQGRCTAAIMAAIDFPWRLLPQEPAAADACVAEAVSQARRDSIPFALIVRDKTFAPLDDVRVPQVGEAPAREAALRAIVDAIPEQAVVVCTTGMASRELFDIRHNKGSQYDGDFRVVGSMGHASQIALGIALAQPGRLVFCVDGDGALIMHMGSMAIIGAQQPRNFVHVVLNNGAHDSVGGQPTAGLTIDICGIARACGYGAVQRIERLSSVAGALRTCASRRAGPDLIEVLVAKGARPGLGRPSESPRANKDRLMRFLQQ
jgi:phosphonopyruvate decarboxylase